MGKVVKRVVGGVVDAAKNAPKTIGKTAVNMGKSVIGQTAETILRTWESQ